MKLRTKVWSIVFATTTALVGATVFLGGRMFHQSYFATECEVAAQQSERVGVMLQEEINGLERTARDYGEWNDTVEFAHGRMPGYPEANWTDSSVNNLRIGFMLVYEENGVAVNGVVVPADGGAPAQADEELFTTFAAAVRTIIADREAQSRVKGVVTVGDRLALFAGTAILPQMEPAAPRGAIIVGRWIDETLTARLEHVAGARLGFESMTAPARDATVAAGYVPIGDSEVQAIVRSAETLATRMPLRSPAGDVVAWLTMEHERIIHRQALRDGWWLVGQVVLAALVFGVLFNVLLQRHVITPLERLHHALRAVGADPELSTRVPAAGHDEVAEVGRAINATLDALARIRLEHEAAGREREKLRERLLDAQKMEAVGEFAGGIAHDFNNCLTAVTVWIDLVRHSLAPDDPQQENLGLALAAAEHATAVVKQLLAYSRHSAPALSPLGLADLLGDSLPLFRAGLPRSVSLKLHVAGGHDRVMADRTQIQQVVMNLVKNAADAMEQHGELALSVGELTVPDARWPGTEALPAGRYVRLSVHDSGPGIDPAVQQRIFEPFFTTKAKGRGTGLGLAVVHNVVLRHAGAVGVESDRERGTTFHVYLPAQVAAETPDVAVAGGLRGVRVLLVEDDADVRRTIEAMLGELGCVVTCAEDGEQAWEVFASARELPHVVLTDLHMPRLSGLQLGDRIIGSGRSVPVVLMTAFAGTLDAEQLRVAGFAALLPKPLGVERLAEAIAVATRRK